MPDRLYIQLNEKEVQVMLLWLHAVSEITWTDPEAAQHMQLLSDRFQHAVRMQMPHLSTFNQDKGAPISDFT